MAFWVNFRGVIWFRKLNIISVTKVVLKVPAIVDHFFVLSLRILWRSYNTSFHTIDALAPLSNGILILHTLEFLFSYVVPGLIYEFVEFLPSGFSGKITPKVLGNKSVAVNNCSQFEINSLWGLAYEKRSNRHVV